jgi:hypothetical protein
LDLDFDGSLLDAALLELDSDSRDRDRDEALQGPDGRSGAEAIDGATDVRLPTDLGVNVMIL